MELEKTEKLKVYFMLARPANIAIANELPCYTLAYTEKEAIFSAMSLVQKRNLQGHYVIQNLGKIEAIELLEKIAPKIPEAIPSKQTFIQELSLLKDEYVTDKKDKAAVARIMKKYGND